jgi:hypothetical protein
MMVSMSAHLPPEEGPHVEIVVPVRNEERDLVPSVTRLVAYLRESFAPTTVITIADNGSSDVLAERAGLRVHEVPVDWTDSPDSRVRVSMDETVEGSAR